MSIKTEDTEGKSFEYDVFISHSSCDKDDLARPLAEALEALGLKVWLDEDQLHIGDSIRREIDSGLRNSRYGVVILSAAYSESEWGLKELDAFFAKEKYESSSILPIHHGVSLEEVEKHWPMLADKVSLNSVDGIDSLANKIQRSIHRVDDNTQIKSRIKKKRNWWPNDDWKWLIGFIVASIIGILTLVIPSQSDTSSAIIIALLKQRSTNIGDDNQSSLQKEQSLNDYKATLERQNQSTLRQLQQGNSEEVADAMERKIIRKNTVLQGKDKDESNFQSSVDREQSLIDREKKFSLEWFDLGNISFLNNSKRALKAYQKAIKYDSDNIAVWNQYGLLQHRLDNLDEAEEAYKKVLMSVVSDKSFESIAYGNLGLIYLSQNKLVKAEKYLGEALKINEEISNKEGIAIQYNNLGLIYHALAGESDLDKAEEYFRDALTINQELKLQIGLARSYAGLGLVAFSRGQLGLAEDYQNQALMINEVHGWHSGVADNKGSLGLIYLKRGTPLDLDKAEKFYKMSLASEEKLGRKIGMASDYGNLGRIYEKRGNLKKACTNWDSSLELFKKTPDGAMKIQELIDENSCSQISKSTH